MALAYGAIPCSTTLRCLTFTTKPWLLRKLSFTSLASALSPIPPSPQQNPDAPSLPATVSCTSDSNGGTPIPTKEPYFPKRGQTIELVCESLAFKGKGVCRVAETGFVVMCDRALPGERFIGRVTRRKGSYAEVILPFPVLNFCGVLLNFDSILKFWGFVIV